MGTDPAGADDPKGRPPPVGGHQSRYDLREIVNAILYRAGRQTPTGVEETDVRELYTALPA